jgi:hypothetical protein
MPTTITTLDFGVFNEPAHDVREADDVVPVIREVVG